MSLIRMLLVWAALCLPLDAYAIAGVSHPSGWQAVLVAGDNAQPVFDNAVAAVRDWLASRGIPARHIHVLSATQGRDGGEAAEPASAERILARIAALHPRRGEGCLVFVTSHGQRGEGIWLAYGGEFLRPADLARALSAGCAHAPTVVIASGCFTGGFTAMRAPSRIVVTAARSDRPSFGCAVERTYAVFDECLIASLSREATWRAVVAATRGCVREREGELQATPSEPQATFGANVRNLPVP
jgi:Peptidase C13 family